MKLARVVGNVVSTIKEKTHYGKKMLIVQPINTDGSPLGARIVALDAVDAGIGDVVLLCVEGGSAKIALNDKDVIINAVVTGVVDYYTVDGVTRDVQH